jgi:hypothetical protein
MASNRVARPSIQVQITVAVAHEAVFEPLVEQGRGPLQLSARARREVGHLFGREEIGALGQLLAVLFHHPVQARRATALGLVAEELLGLGVKGRDGIGRIGHQLGRQLVVRRQPIKEILLAKAFHDHQPLDRRSVAAERQAAVRSAGHGLDPQIEIRGGAPVDLHFLLAAGPAARQGRKVHIGKLDRALHFVGASASQEHHGRVGVEAQHRTGLGTVSLGLGQERRHLALVSHHMAGVGRPFISSPRRHGSKTSTKGRSRR